MRWNISCRLLSAARHRRQWAKKTRAHVTKVKLDFSRLVIFWNVGMNFTELCEFAAESVRDAFWERFSIILRSPVKNFSHSYMFIWIWNFFVCSAWHTPSSPVNPLQFLLSRDENENWFDWGKISRRLRLAAYVKAKHKSILCRHSREAESWLNLIEWHYFSVRRFNISFFMSGKSANPICHVSWIIWVNFEDAKLSQMSMKR